MKFNINSEVKVKMKPMGHAIHRAAHMKLYHDYPLNSKPEYVPIKEDEEGWSTWQLWRLMNEFGEHLYNGAEIPFEAEIEIVDDMA